jgi:hypothetical protein
VTDLSATPTGDGGIELRWSDPSTSNSAYYLQYLETWYGGLYGYYEWWTSLVTLGPDDTRYNVAGWASDKFHQFRILAGGPDARSDASPVAGSWTRHDPSTPTGLVATVVAGAVELRWTDNALDETAVEVQRCDIAMGYCTAIPYYYPIATLAADVTTYRDETPAPGSTPSYRVVAIKDGVPYLPSSIVWVTVPGSPPD